MKITLGAVVILLCFVSCGKEGNVADCDAPAPGIPCSERTPDEEARLALDREDFETAVMILSELVEEEPENYQRYTVLSAAMAGQAGLDIFNLAKGQFAGDGGILSLVGSFLPDPTSPTYSTSVTTMDDAVSLLESIPADKRSATSAEKYASSAAFQLTLYQTSYSIMYLNQFTQSVDPEEVDVTNLDTMTEDDAEIIVESLAQAAANGAAGGDPEVQAKIEEALAELGTDDGTSKKEKLIAYYRKEKGLAPEDPLPTPTPES